MIDDTGTFENQPSNVAIFGNITLSADLSAYQSQIVTVVPEPGGAALLIGAALGLCARRRK
jgi:hypothetical protein